MSTERTALLASAEGRSAGGGPATRVAPSERRCKCTRLNEARFGLRWIQSLVDRFRGEEFDDDRHCETQEESGGWQAPPRVVIYQEVETLADEMPRAERTMERAQVALKELVTECRSKGALRIEKAEEIVGELVDSMVRNPNALMWLARLKNLDSRAYSHSLECAIYTVAMGLQLGLDRTELAILSSAGLMLDVGKLRVPSQLLERRASSPTPSSRQSSVTSVRPRHSFEQRWRRRARGRGGSSPSRARRRQRLSGRFEG